MSRISWLFLHFITVIFGPTTQITAFSITYNHGIHCHSLNVYDTLFSFMKPNYIKYGSKYGMFSAIFQIHSNYIPVNMVRPLQLGYISNIAHVEEEAFLYTWIYFCVNSSKLTGIKRRANSRKWSTFFKNSA